MSRSPAGHYIPDSLAKRVPYTDTLRFDEYEISMGYGHQEILHLLGIVIDDVAPKAKKIKALRLLADIFPGREDEAIQLNAISVIKPFLAQQPNGLLLHSISAITALVNNADHANFIVSDIPKIVKILSPDVEPPLRLAAATLLCRIAEFVGPVNEFTQDKIPTDLVTAVAYKDSSKEFINEMFYLLSRLTNVQKVRVPIISSTELLARICKSISDPYLSDSAMILSNNIAMDKSHHGKIALLNSGIIDVINPLLRSDDKEIRMSALSLIALLAVPKDGKELLSTMPDTADLLQKISETDPDMICRDTAMKCRIFIAEIPFGKAIVGDVVDPSRPVLPKPDDDEDE